MKEWWPESVDGWVTLLVGVMAIAGAAVGAVLKWVRQPLTTQINGLGDRVNTLEKSDARHDARLLTLDEETRTGRFERREATERISRLEKAVEQLLQAVTMNREQGMEENGDIRERLARIESKVDDLRPKQR